jgi:hypothetical protein
MGNPTHVFNNHSGTLLNQKAALEVRFPMGALDNQVFQTIAKGTFFATETRESRSQKHNPV